MHKAQMKILEPKQSLKSPVGDEKPKSGNTACLKFLISIEDVPLRFNENYVSNVSIKKSKLLFPLLPISVVLLVCPSVVQNFLTYSRIVQGGAR